MVHLSERLYKCSLCAETFSLKKARKVHMKTHQQQQFSGAAVVPSIIAPTASTTDTQPSPSAGRAEGIDLKHTARPVGALHISLLITKTLHHSIFWIGENHS